MRDKVSEPKRKFVWVWGIALACSGCPCTLSISLLELISYQIQEEFQNNNIDVVEIIRKSLFLPIIIAAPISCFLVSLGVPFRPLLIVSTILYVILGSLTYFIYNLIAIIVIRSLFGIFVGILEGVSMALMPLSADFYPKSITRPMLAGARAGFGSIVSCLCTFIAPAVSSTHSWRTLCLFCLVVALYIPAWCITPDPFEEQSHRWILRRLIKEHRQKIQTRKNKDDIKDINAEESEILNRRSTIESKDQVLVEEPERNYENNDKKNCICSNKNSNENYWENEQYEEKQSENFENVIENEDPLYVQAINDIIKELSKEVDDKEEDIRYGLYNDPDSRENINKNNKQHKGKQKNHHHGKKKHNSTQDLEIDEKLAERRISTLADLSCNIDFNKPDTNLNEDIIDSLVREKKHKHQIISNHDKIEGKEGEDGKEINCDTKKSCIEEEKESLISESDYEENTFETSGEFPDENIESLEISMDKDSSEKSEQRDYIVMKGQNWRIEECYYPVKFIPLFIFCLVVQIFNSGLIANTDSHIRHVVVDDPVADEMTVQTMIIVFDSLCYFMNGVGSLIVPLIWTLYLKIPALIASTANYLLAATSLLGLGIGFIILSIVTDYRASTAIASAICGTFGGFIVPDCNMWSTKISPPMWLFFSMGLLTSATNIAKYISPWVISSISSLEEDTTASQKQYFVGGVVLIVMFMCYFTIGTVFAVYSNIKLRGIGKRRNKSETKTSN